MEQINKGRTSDLIPDDKNFNKHTERGLSMLRKSIDRFGFGRSILVDKNNRIIGGNGVHEMAGDAETVVVETTGDKLVVVKRNDIDLDTKEGRELALADNATAAADLNWDTDQLTACADGLGIDLDDWGCELDKKERDKTGAVKFTEVLGEEHNYVVLFCDNNVDWLQMQTIFEVGDCRELSTARGRENTISRKKGVARVIRWADAYERIKRHENIG